MKKNHYKYTIAAATVSLLLTASLQSVSSAGSGPTSGSSSTNTQSFQGTGPWQVDNNSATVVKACPASADAASCSALVLGVDRVKGQNPFGSGSSNGAGSPIQMDTFANNYFALSPAQIITAYKFPTTDANGALPGTGKIIAIVDAYDNPNIVPDLATFNSQFGIPQLASCTITSTSGPCFQKVGETSTTPPPTTYDAGWAMEISLDVEWAHAIAPGASILLVEAKTSGWGDLMKAAQYAATRAQYVSMSFGGQEMSNEKTFDGAFTNTAVSFFAAAGDGGLYPEYPSVSPKVISVGGTTLNLTSTGTISSETGWASGGGGCSTIETATNAQAAYPTYAQVNCGGKRATPDVAANADPNTGGYMYTSNNYGGTTGWFTVGGTSLSTPIWAARAANTGIVVNQAYIYGTNSINFNNISVGGNLAGCLVGYSLSCGLGSWNN